MRIVHRVGGLLAAALLAVGPLVLGGCAGTSPSEAPASPSPAGFTNPVYDSNFPDPMIVADPAGGWWAVATNGNGSNVQTLRSTDLVEWEQGPDALPTLPSWSSAGKVWAPEVIAGPDGGYLLYYTTRGPDPAVQCVSVATASQPAGPYVDNSDKPLVCEADQGGTIDAHPFVDDTGQRYLYWKNDGNAVGVDTYLSASALDAAGTRLTGKPKRLFKQNQPWEGSLVEGPFVWADRGRLHLFYSANDYGSDAYAVGHAVADSPLGPFTKTEDPVLTTNDVAAGPGHCSLFASNGRVWMVYHAWTPGEIGGDFPGRAMWLSEVTFAQDGTVSVVPPTVDYPTRP